MTRTPYYVGIDAGTNAVGWSVTDTKYKLLRAKGKDMWGVREFNAAASAKDRRTYRTARRRRQREVARMGLIKNFFSEEIAKKDPAFFFRLEESKYHTEDKKTGTKYTLFADHAYTDKEYFEQYPTIFHLRKELMDNPEEHDVRMVYLAIANMFKHRGHFLNSGIGENDGIGSFEAPFLQLMNMAEVIEFPVAFSMENMKEIESVLSSRSETKKQKQEKLIALLGVNKTDKENIELIAALCGMKIKPVKLFHYVAEDLFNEEAKKISFSFGDELEETMNTLESVLDTDYMEFLQTLRDMYNASSLAGIMKGYPTLSHARVASYEKHKADLRCLKNVIAKYCPDEYDRVFREMALGGYSAYVGSVNSGKTKQRRFNNKDKSAKFFDNIKDLIEKIPECSEKEYILKEIENETFLPKQLTRLNGVIPNQVHLQEMKIILGNAENYLTFLKEKDETGFSVSEKICQLFAFKLPYYIGPLKNTETNNAWVVRTDKEGSVYPWNLQEMVDIYATRKEFIEKMVKTCTYMRNEKVLPKCSLLHEKFQVLNELNNLRIGETKLTIEQKQDLFNTLFMGGKKVTKSALEKYLIGHGLVTKDMTSQINGIDDDFKSYCSSYGKFYHIFGEELKKESVQAIAEGIIYWGTIFGEEKAIFMEKVKEDYGEILTPEQMKRISGFKFKGWGRLSREFLKLPGCSKEDGEILPLIDMMWERNVNMMELLSDKYTYQDELMARTEEVVKTLHEVTYDDLDGMYLSAPVKRMLWQTILLLDEIVSVMGYPPEKIFIEMARDNAQKKGKTPSRKEQLLNLYKSCKKDPVLAEIKKDLESREERELRSKKLFLYYMQQGRCMYTGNIIDINELFNDNLYDIDHIYARHFVKDDSIMNNLVLVDKKENARKTDDYPIDISIRQKQKAYWDSLLKKGFITKEKHKRLTGSEKLTDEQLAGFIMRQLVETRQGTKVLSKILEMAFGRDKVVYVKAGLVSDFRHDFKDILKVADGVSLGKETDDDEKYYPLLKSRAVNNFHHAQDAYLNIVVGNVYHVKFTKNPANFVKEYRKNPDKNKFHMNKVFLFDVRRNSETAWIARGEDASVHVVKKMVDKNSPIITRMSFEAHGQLYKATLYGKNKATANAYIPLKSSDERIQDVSQYGGYTSVTGAYFFLVEHEVKKKKVRTLEFMPLYLKDKVGDDVLVLEKYCKDDLGLINPSIRLKKIKIQSLLKINGYYMHLSGRTGNDIAMRNAIPLCLNRKWINYIKKVEQCADDGLLRKEISEKNNLLLYDILTNKMNEGIFSKRPNFVGLKLKNGQKSFETLTQEHQCKVLVQMLKLTTLGITEANLVDIDLDKTTGGLKVNKKLSNNKEVKLIYQSPTGLFEKEVNLLTV